MASASSWPSDDRTCWTWPRNSSATIHSPGRRKRPASRSLRSTAPRLRASSARGRPQAALHAGHSLGELAALATAGALSEADGLRLAVERGRLMDEAATEAPGGMLAVGCDRAEALALAVDSGLSLANENSPKQFILSGANDRLDRAEHKARELGLRAKRLAVAGAFHSPLMEPAVARFEAAMDRIEFRQPEMSVISGVAARAFPADPRAELSRRSSARSAGSTSFGGSARTVRGATSTSARAKCSAGSFVARSKTSK